MTRKKYNFSTLHSKIVLSEEFSFILGWDQPISNKSSVSEALWKQISEGRLPTFILRMSLNGFQISYFLKEYYRLCVNTKDICEKLLINSHLLCSIMTEKHHYIFRLSTYDSHISFFSPFWDSNWKKPCKLLK